MMCRKITSVRVCLRGGGVLEFSYCTTSSSHYIYLCTRCWTFYIIWQYIISICASKPKL
uniref:Uncharacterized protein n=1 Tax=Arundo donax TaxID=35708 RepID=A0A0A9BIX4_ARUDO